MPSGFSRSVSAFRLVWPWFAAVGSGATLALAFPPFDADWLVWVALAPLAGALLLAPRRAAVTGFRQQFIAVLQQPGPFLLGWVAGLAFCLIAFSWIIEVTGPGWVLVAAYLALYFGAWGWVTGTFLRAETIDGYLSSSANLQRALVGAATWTGLEWLRGVLFSGFTWNTLGVALHANLPFIQHAAYGGVGILSFLLVWVNLIGALTIIRFAHEIRTGKLRPHFDFTVTMAMIVAAFALGFAELYRKEPNPPLHRLTVTMVQPAVPQTEKFDLAFQNEVFERLRRFSEIAIATKPQLLLWPEAATPTGIFANQRDHDLVTELARKGDFHFLVGSLDYDFAPDGQRSDFNAAILLPGGGGDAQIYRKMHLVPFGEFIPFRKSFPLFVWIMGDQVPGDFQSGREPAVFDLGTPAVKLGPLICFEDTIGELARQPVLRGAQVLVNITNDGWFHRSAASAQHLAAAVFRAVENHRPLLRCANTGVTCIIDAHGRQGLTLRDEAGDTFAPGVLNGWVDVRADAPLTFYTRNGDVFSIVCGVFAAVATGVSAALARAKRRRAAGAG